MSSYTRLGASLWDWEQFTALDNDARVLWLALYTSPEAKRIVPGLWHGSIISMAEAARLPGDVVVKALDTLLDRELVEFDAKHRVLRLVELPDPGESPSNGKMIRGWWHRFRTVPVCPVRNAHVVLLRWIMDEGGKESKGGSVSTDHENAWRDTFATVPIPPPRKRGVRRLLMDYDTGTKAQPGLFDSHSSVAASVSDGRDTVSDDERSTSDGTSVENSDVLHQSNKIRGPETVSDTVSKRLGSGPGSGPRPGVSSSLRSEPEPSNEPTLDHVPRRPALALVPMFTPEQLLAAITAESREVFAPRVPEGLSAALCATISALDGAGVVLADIALAGQWLRRPEARREIPGDGDPAERLARWASYPGAVAAAITTERELQRVAEAKREALHTGMAALGMRPT